LEDASYGEHILAAALQLKGPAQKQLFRLACRRRSLCFPQARVEARSVLEISNICRQRCNFCGMNRDAGIPRYLIGRADTLHIARQVYARGRRVLLIQSGESAAPRFVEHVCRCVQAVKSAHRDLVVILCLGNLLRAQYRQLKDAGADRYILKFETSNPALYRKIKPGDRLSRRVARIQELIALGFEVGSGNMVGLPGQTTTDIARDLLFLSRFKLSMGSSSVFIPGESCRYRGLPPGDVDMTLNCMALIRIMYPHLLIPATSSLEKLRKGGQFLGLTAGANAVTVHDGSPARVKKNFPIYSPNRFIPNERHVRAIVRRAGLHFSSDALDRPRGEGSAYRARLNSRT